MSDPDGFRTYVEWATPGLVRAAWLLTGEEHAAQDLVQSALLKAWRRWGRLRRQEAADAYVRRIVYSTFLNWRALKSTSEQPAAVLPEREASGDYFAAVDLRWSMREALLDLPVRQRAVIVLRYFEDMTEEQAAHVLGCSVGTVKSQASKALTRLRGSPHLGSELGKEATR